MFRRLDVSADSVKAELAKLAFANLGDFMTIGPDGLPHTDFTHATREQLAGLAELTVDERASTGKGKAKRVRLKLADKRAALVDLGRTLSMFTDKMETKNRVINIEMTADDLAL